MRKPFYIVLLLLTVAACGGQGRHEAALRHAQSVLNERPDSALAILDSLGQYRAGFTRSALMRWQLLRLSAQNKCDTVFLSDSLQRELVGYFDRHGTANERMTAHYLLGRAYSDMGEAPMALQCFLDAVSCADTTAADCDFYSLSGVFGQMAFVYESQHLYDEEIEAWERFSHYSQKAGDVFGFIKGQEYKVVPYYAKGDTATCFQLTEKVHHLYLDHGYPEKADGVYYTAIMILLDNGQYSCASRLMRLFEGNSGFFDSCGNIKSGMEHYYYSKGLYYLGVHHPDSAEFFFRKLLRYHVNKDYEACKGLLSVYQSRCDADSILKYSMLCERALDSIQAEDQSEAVSVTHSLYNYNRMGRLASQRALELERRKKWIWVVSMMFLITVTAGTVLFRKQRKAREAELGRLSSERMAAIRQLETSQQELHLLEQNNKSMIEKKKEEIVRLSEKVAEYESRFVLLPDEKREAALQNDETVLLFWKKAKGKREESLPEPSEWTQLKAVLQKNIPDFYKKVVLKGGLSEQESQTCMLCRLGFHTGEIAVLLDTTSQRITNAKSSSGRVLFGDSKASSLKSHLMEL